jgi:hypothetical protein
MCVFVERGVVGEELHESHDCRGARLGLVWSFLEASLFSLFFEWCVF